MRTKTLVLYLGIIALFVGLLVNSAKADLYWETRSVSTNIPHQPNGTSIQKYYFTPYASRVELGGGRVIIVDYRAMKLYSLDTRAKTCTEIILTELPGLPHVAAADQEKMAAMMGAVMGIQVTPTNKFKTIAGYRCRKYIVRIAIMNGEYWVSKDVKGYRELKILGTKVGAIAERNPIFRQINIAGMVKKLDGFPVYTVNHVMGGTVASTLVKIQQKSLDPALFIVPKGYTMKKIR